MADDMGEAVAIAMSILADLGQAKRVVIEKENTTIIEGTGKAADIKGRVEQINAEIADCSSDYDKEKLQERVAKLSGGVAVIKVGAATEVEMKEKKARVEDALHATRAAVEEGVVPGGGVALIRAVSAIAKLKGDNDDQNVGIRIENCLFHDMPNAIVLTTLDCGRRRGPGNELLTAENIKTYAPHDIEMNSCVVGHAEKPLRSRGDGGYGVDYPEQGEHMRLILLKDAYAIQYRNARLFGDRIKPVLIHSIGGSSALSKEAADAIDRSVTGNILDEPAPPVEPGVTKVPFACGPQPLD